MYSLSFAAAFTTPEAVAAFIFKDETRKVHALKKKHSVEQKKNLFPWKEIPQIMCYYLE